MKLQEAVEILKKHNRWRRDTTSTIPQPMDSPKELGKAIDAVVALLERKTPSRREVYVYGLDVFDLEFSKFYNWLIRYNHALDGRIPEELLETEEGRMEVMDCLKRIEYGIFN